MPLINSKKLVAAVASGHTSVSMGPTDICKTPAPPAPAPVPIPYPNVALSATMGPGYTTKTLVTATPMWTKNGSSALSNGDQPGVAMGIMSSKIMGMCEITMACNDVDAEGGGIARILDSTNSNVLATSGGQGMGKPSQSAAALQLMGLGNRGIHKKDPLCAAFRKAAKSWCRRNKARKKKKNKGLPTNRDMHGDFTEAITGQLQQAAAAGNPAAASALASLGGREASYLLQRGSGVFIGFVANLVAGGAAAGMTGGAGAATHAYAALVDTAQSGLSGGVAAASSAAGPASLAQVAGNVNPTTLGATPWMRQNLQLRRLDGRLADGRLVEVKGPTDCFHDTQAEDLLAASNGQAPMVLTCETCDSGSCTVGPDGKSRCN